jgi:septum formation protein
MFTACHPLILASASPRRRQFLDQLGLEFLSAPAAIDETPLSEETPEAFARRMASSKAASVAHLFPGACIIAADTVVALGETLFGKPANPADALAILQQLHSQTHRVITACTVLFDPLAINDSLAETTLVTFGTFDNAVLKAYADSGDPLDKAGAYGIQGKGTFLVDSISGSYSNVVGLPVNQLVRLLLKHHIIRPD